MAESPTSDLHSSKEEDPVSASSLRFEVFNGGNSVPKDVDGKRGKPDLRAISTVGSNSARYKSMSPARLPISRSPCLTIPPGLSPTTLLDSPVLLSNPKAEPSPTTGTFPMHPTMHDAVNSDSLFLRRDITYDNTCDEGSSGEFEFKPHTNSCSGSNLSSLGHLAPAGSNYHQRKPVAQIQGQYHSQKFAFSPSITTESIKASSDDFTLSVPASVPPVYMVTSRASASTEVAGDESRQRQGSESGTQSIHSDITDHKGPNPLVAVEKSLEDGYNWRKYGQKHVKGSEFPRSYYKCTHPNCQVKKLLERSHDGHITDVTYKGSHDHPKPLPGRRSALGAILSCQTEEQCDRLSSLIGADSNLQKLTDDDKLLNAHGQQSHQIEPNGNYELSPHCASEDDKACVGARSNKIGDDVDDDDDGDDDPESKRRKTDIGGVDVTPMVKATREPRVVVQTQSEVDILDDGYRWRKYGQKVVKGNPNPRSYYKCTNAGCPVRKHVERASHDPKAVITTYEGKHNHDVPSARTSNRDSAGPMIPNDASALNSHMSANLSSIVMIDEDDIVSLDLGVGISLSPENMSNEKQQTPNTEQAHAQNEMTGSGCSNMIQSTPVSARYGRLVKDGVDYYGPGGPMGESFSFKTPPLNHPTDTYRQNVGRLVMGP